MAKTYGVHINTFGPDPNERTRFRTITAAQLTQVDFGSLTYRRGFIVEPIPILNRIFVLPMSSAVRVEWNPDESMAADMRFLERAIRGIFETHKRLALNWRIVVRFVRTRGVIYMAIPKRRSGAAMYQRLNYAARSLWERAVEVVRETHHMIDQMAVQNTRME